jgi:hypothetical protein
MVLKTHDQMMAFQAHERPIFKTFIGRDHAHSLHLLSILGKMVSSECPESMG